MKKLLLLFVVIPTLSLASYIEYADDLILKSLNEDIGLVNKDHSIQQEDDARFSIVYHINSSFMDAFALTTLEGNYAQRLDVAWLEFYLAYTIGQPHQFEGNESTETENNAFIHGGAGLSYRMSYIQYLFNQEKIFETTAAYLTYGRYTDKVSENDFGGFGLRTDYGIHYRATATMHYGVKFSYNFSSVYYGETDPPTSKNSRSKGLSWFSIGADLSFYF